MASGRGKEIAIAVVGLVAFAAILVRFGMLRHAETPDAPVQVAAPVQTPQAVSASPQAPSPQALAAVAPSAPAAPPSAAGTQAGSQAVSQAPSPAPGAQAALTPAPATAPAPAPEPAPAPAASVPAPAAPPAPEPLPRPSFDVARVEPDGSAVVAGRGAPGAKVELLVNGAVHGSMTADANGQFVFTPADLKDFPVGPSEVTLRLVGPDGTSSISTQSLTVVVAENRRDAPLVTKAEPDKATVVLSQPAPAPVAAAPAAPAPAPVTPAPATPAPAVAAAPMAPAPAPPRQALRVVSVEAEEGGKLFVTGQGAPGAQVRLYLNDTFIAPGIAGADGKIVFSIQRGVTAGEYSVRLDEVGGADGVVSTRAEVPFTMPVAAAAVPAVAQAAPAPAPAAPAPAPAAPAPAPATPVAPPAVIAMPDLPPEVTPFVTGPGAAEAAARAVAAATAAPAQSAPTPAPTPAPTAVAGTPGTVIVPQVNTTVVVRGDSLWRISRRVYGRGVRYTVIYEANQDQIRNPRRIYPGQVFVLPGIEEGGAAAAPR